MLVLIAFLTFNFKPFKRLIRNKQGMAKIGGGIVGVLIGIMVTLLVGVIVVTNLVGSVTPDTTWSASANTTWSTLQSNVWVAFTLLVILPIIIGAVAIMGYLRAGGGF